MNFFFFNRKIYFKDDSFHGIQMFCPGSRSETSVSFFHHSILLNLVATHLRNKIFSILVQISPIYSNFTVLTVLDPVETDSLRD